MYEFVIDLDAAEDDTESPVTDEIHPFLFMRGVDVKSEVACEIYACGFGVPGVRDVVDMAYRCIPSDSNLSGRWGESSPQREREYIPFPQISHDGC
jgi:hypothetical protein